VGPSRQTSASQSATVWMCYGAMMCLAIAVNLTPVYLTTFGETFGGENGLSEEQLGRIPGLTFLSLTLVVILCGPLADRLGGKLFSVLGLAFVGGGVALVAAAQNYEMLLGAGCLMGIGTGILDMILSPIVSVMRPERRASAMNWLHSFYSIGAVCSVLFGTYALLKLPWRMVWGIMALLPAVVLVGFALVKVPPLVHDGQQRMPVRKLATYPYFIFAVLAIFMIGGTEHGIVQWLPAFAERSLKLTKFAGGNMLLGYLVVMVLGRVLAASVGRRIRPIHMMLVCSVLSAGLIAVLALCPVVPVAVAAGVFVGMTASCLWPTLLGVTADRFPRGGATMFAVLSASGNAGCFASAWLVGIIADATRNLNQALATIVLCPVVLTLALLWMKAHRQAPAPDEYPAASAPEN